MKITVVEVGRKKNQFDGVKTGYYYVDDLECAVCVTVFMFLELVGSKEV